MYMSVVLILKYTPRYNWNSANVGVKRLLIATSIVVLRFWDMFQKSINWYDSWSFFKGCVIFMKTSKWGNSIPKTITINNIQIQHKTSQIRKMKTMPRNIKIYITISSSVIIVVKTKNIHLNVISKNHWAPTLSIH